MIILLTLIFITSLWIAYELWRAPLVREEEDGNITTIRRTREWKDLFRKTGREFDNGEKYYNETYNKQTMTKEEAKTELIKLLENQVMDLVAMSKIELGDDVIAEIKRLRTIIGE
jgi:hypothetical protein